MLLTVALLMSAQRSGPARIADAMTAHAVAVVKSNKEYAVRDLSTGKDLFALPGSPEFVCDVAYDGRTHDLYVLAHRPHRPAAIYWTNLSPGSLGWVVHELPKENWADLLVNGLEEGSPEGVPVRLLLNPKCVAVVYEGPRIRLLSRPLLKNRGEVKLNNGATRMIQGPYIDCAELSSDGKAFGVCVNNRMTNSFSQPDIYLGEFGRPVTHASVDDPSGERYYCTGLFPLGKTSWACMFIDGTIQAFTRRKGGRYVRWGKPKQLGKATQSSTFDSVAGWAYVAVQGGIRSFSLSDWPRVRRVNSDPAKHLPDMGSPQLSTFGRSKWLIEADGQVGALWEKGPNGRLTCRGTLKLPPNQSLVTIHG